MKANILIVISIAYLLVLLNQSLPVPPLAAKEYPVLERTVELSFLPMLQFYDEFRDVPLGPLDSCLGELWSGKVCLSESLLLEETDQIPRVMVTTKSHIVQAGENLWNIAQKYDLDVATLAGANHDISNIHNIVPGQELRILSEKGTIHLVVEGDTFNDILQKYKVCEEDILECNDLEPSSIFVGQEIIIPGVEPLDLQNRGGGQTGYIWPVKTGWVSSPFGMRWDRMHEGIDIAVANGTSVYAAKAGKVRFSGWSNSFGNYLEIDHGSGVITRYAHNDKLLVKNGQTVHQGQIIAHSGNTGSSTGPHLHFEIRINNKAVNPLNYLPKR